jgi:ferredoxin
MQWTPGAGSLLRLAESHGLQLPSGCQVGQCESCLLRVRSGRFVHWTPVELADNDNCLGCVAVPASDMVLDA